MPRRARELSPVESRRLATPGVYPAGGVADLILQVKNSGAQSWLLRYVTGATRTRDTGKTYPARREMDLDRAPEVTLAQARERAREAREKLRQRIATPLPRTRRPWTLSRPPTRRA